jgi:hypothetical protein
MSAIYVQESLARQNSHRVRRPLGRHPQAHHRKPLAPAHRHGDDSAARGIGTSTRSPRDPTSALEPLQRRAMRNQRRAASQRRPRYADGSTASWVHSNENLSGSVGSPSRFAPSFGWEGPGAWRTTRNRKARASWQCARMPSVGLAEVSSSPAWLSISWSTMSSHGRTPGSRDDRACHLRAICRVRTDSSGGHLAVPGRVCSIQRGVPWSWSCRCCYFIFTWPWWVEEPALRQRFGSK